jgi:glycosidase
MVVARVLLFLGLLCFSELALAQSASNGFWQAQSIYQIVTDRFYDGDPSNDNADGNYNPTRSRGAHGGDFKGIEQKLDYIKALGATAIWISPIVLNARGEYHGYAARDFYKIDPRWGTLEDLQHMVEAAHARGLLVIDDIVVNHGGDLVYSTDPGYGNFRAPPDGYHLTYRDPARTYPPPFDLNATNPSLTNLFHNNGLIGNYQDPNQVVLGELAGLDDFRTESPYVRRQMTAIYEYWIKQAGFDGFPRRYCQHVEMGFWKEWCPAIHAFAAAHGRPNFFMFGEVLDGSERCLCGSFTGRQSGGTFRAGFSAGLPALFAVKNVFARATGAPGEIEDHYRRVDRCYDPSARLRLVTFLDNHDQPRFFSRDQANDDLAAAQVRPGFSLHRAGHPLSLLRDRTGLQRRQRSRGPRRHVRRPIQGRPARRGQFQHDSSALPVGGAPEQFPAPLRSLASRLASGVVERDQRPVASWKKDTGGF